MEYLLHISYRLTLPQKTWNVTQDLRGMFNWQTETHFVIFKDMQYGPPGNNEHMLCQKLYFAAGFDLREEEVKKRVEDALGVRIDQVLQGHGTINTGNVARKCFSKPETFAIALQLDVELVQKLALLIYNFKSKHPLNFEKIQDLCDEIRDIHDIEYY